MNVSQLTVERLRAPGARRPDLSDKKEGVVANQGLEPRTHGL
jgi:hypothetical protein